MLQPRVRSLLSSLPYRFQHRRTMSVFSSKRLENKTVLVTGASAGIGEVRLIRQSLTSPYSPSSKATAILFAKVRI